MDRMVRAVVCGDRLFRRVAVADRAEYGAKSFRNLAVK